MVFGVLEWWWAVGQTNLMLPICPIVLRWNVSRRFRQCCRPGPERCRRRHSLRSVRVPLIHAGCRAWWAEVVHSVELLFDPETEAVIRASWDALRAAGVQAQAAAARPHTTLTVANQIDDAVLPTLAGLAGAFPFEARIGAALVFGRSAGILARLVVPSVELLDLHAEVARRTAPHLRPGPLPHTVPGDWTPHVTLARRVSPDRLAAALHIAARPADIAATVSGLRLWNGNARKEIQVI